MEPPLDFPCGRDPGRLPCDSQTSCLWRRFTDSADTVASNVDLCCYFGLSQQFFLGKGSVPMSTSPSPRGILTLLQTDNPTFPPRSILFLVAVGLITLIDVKVAVHLILSSSNLDKRLPAVFLGSRLEFCGRPLGTVVNWPSEQFTSSSTVLQRQDFGHSQRVSDDNATPAAKSCSRLRSRVTGRYGKKTWY
ncbi:hypothetical protein FQN60_007366 [Etheostoma spectabile]|uniref:Uncharacterized protein n=1 Tax=Etheostoma spectabile TaxID=54343 RepID=A0A5J5CVI5_9PERO|nr:hypothetical protein FQN60_007366 [Etheostoma spectabile]